MSKVRASVVVPTLDEAGSIPELSQRLRKVLDEEDLDWDVLFVDDGSRDDSFAVLRALHDADSRFKVLRFSRNFGSHIAISAGLDHAEGDVAIVITADLEEPPEAIPALLSKWREGHEIVWGIRAPADGKLRGGLGSRMYHRLFAWLAESGPGQDEIGGGLFLADTKAIRALRRFPERNRNVVGLLLWAGFRHARVPYTPARRALGRSKWSFAKKLNLAIDTFVGFSRRPLRLVSGLGLAFFSLGLVVLAAALVANFMGAAAGGVVLVSGALAALSLLLGVQLVAMGLLGEYVARAFDEVRGRPLYVVRDHLGEGRHSA